LETVEGQKKTGEREKNGTNRGKSAGRVLERREQTVGLRNHGGEKRVRTEQFPKWAFAQGL
jgi:hypothetical protein